MLSTAIPSTAPPADPESAMKPQNVLSRGARVAVIGGKGGGSMRVRSSSPRDPKYVTRRCRSSLTNTVSRIQVIAPRC
jgi:hypothetical protein